MPQLLTTRKGGSDFLSALTPFVNAVLAGRCPADVAPKFFGGRLIALSKKTGGIRPIVVGFTLRHLVSKCANSHSLARLAPWPLLSVPPSSEWAFQGAARLQYTQLVDF